MSFLGILEKILLRESASADNVTRAMDNHSKVIINYHSNGKDEHTGTRIIEPVCYGLTSSGNPVVRAYQPYGDSTTRTPGWKLFRLDRISYWEETGVKFGNIPDFNISELNQDGDKSMTTVIKSYKTTVKDDLANKVNTGPQTKEKVRAVTRGDKMKDLGMRNIENMSNGGIKVDLSNNSQPNSTFNAYTNDTQTSKGPRLPDQSYQPLDVSGSVTRGDISQEELDNARKLVQQGEYHHFTPEEWDAMYDQMKSGTDETDKYQKVKDRRWDRSSDSRFLNRKNSANRELFNMETQDEDE